MDVGKRVIFSYYTHSQQQDGAEAGDLMTSTTSDHVVTRAFFVQ